MIDYEKYLEKNNKPFLAALESKNPNIVARVFKVSVKKANMFLEALRKQCCNPW